jgi:hypothetical protein
MRMLIRTIGLWLVHTFGTRLIDVETGRDLGRAFVFGWRGKIQVVGLKLAVRPLFLPQKRLTYWKQELGFTTHPPPDFPNVRSTSVERRGEEHRS